MNNVDEFISQINNLLQINADPAYLAKIKAVSWTLKEASKKDERQVFEYLIAWKDKANPRITKAGSEKLSPELRKELFE